MPLFEMVRLYFRQPKELCVTAFGEPEFEYWVRAEDRAVTYNILPFAGGQLDQPLIVLEILDLIRGAKVQYQIAKQERQEMIDKLNAQRTKHKK